MSRVRAVCLGAFFAGLVGCGPPPVLAPPAPVGEGCPFVGEADPVRELPKLQKMFREKARDLIVVSGRVYEIPCSAYKVEGAAEASTIRGASEQSTLASGAEGSLVKAAGEQSRLGAADERSRVAAADERSRVAAADERSKVAAADEASKVRAAEEASRLGKGTEQSDQRNAATVASCERLPLGGYRLVRMTGTAPLRVFDGATIAAVGPDGSIQ